MFSPASQDTPNDVPAGNDRDSLSVLAVIVSKRFFGQKRPKDTKTHCCHEPILQRFFRVVGGIRGSKNIPPLRKQFISIASPKHSASSVL